MAERKHPIAGRRPSLPVVVPGLLQCAVGLHTVLGALGSLGRDDGRFRKSWTDDRLEERKIRDRPVTKHTFIFTCKVMPGASTPAIDTDGTVGNSIRP